MLAKVLANLAKEYSHRPWYQLPKVLGLAVLIEIRNKLRRENLHDTEEPPLEKVHDSDATPAAVRGSRTFDGTSNDLACPRMGSAGTRFGRNFPIEHTFPDTANLLTPNPRVVSRELMTRDTFKEASILNLLAAAWIQFMVHDWFVHRRGPVEEGLEIPLPPQDPWPDSARPMRVPRTVPDPAPPGSQRPPAYANLDSHWWDGSQIYGSDADTVMQLRSGRDGKLIMGDDGRLPVDPQTGLDRTGFSDNWWLGLALFHTLFSREHNHICDQLKAQYPNLSDDELYTKARLINAALMAKIHTVEWTPAILPHPTVAAGMRINWDGVVGDELQEAFRALNESELLGGIPGSPTDHHDVPYALTEEFASVYRMHPLIPDDFTFRSAATDQVVEQLELPDIAGRKTRPVFERHSLGDLFYSFGVVHPGALTLHNYPRHLQLLKRDNGEVLDLAAVDVLRDRERGVPRYNEFRRLLGKEPVRSFEELTDRPEWCEELRRVYDNDLEKVDLMTGLYAEPLPEGFGFSETAFRIFVLMASRRLKSDRFFTSDFREEVYTRTGLEYIKHNGLASVLRRHVPEIAFAFEKLDNPFAPWQRRNSAVP